MKKNKDGPEAKGVLIDPKTGQFRNVKPVFTGKTLEEADRNSWSFILSELETTMKDENARNALLNGPDRQQILDEWYTAHEDRVPDEEFFKIIQEEPCMLGSTFAQEKIERWRNELNDTDLKASIAREKLEKIGKYLIPSSHKGRRKRIETLLAYEKHLISGILSEHLNGPFIHSYEKVEEIFGAEVADDRELSELIKNWKALTPRKIPPLAERIIERQHGLKPGVVKEYIKRVWQIMDSSGNPMFLLKKPK